MTCYDVQNDTNIEHINGKYASNFCPNVGAICYVTCYGVQNDTNLEHINGKYALAFCVYRGVFRLKRFYFSGRPGLLSESFVNVVKLWGGIFFLAGVSEGSPAMLTPKTDPARPLRAYSAESM